MNKIKTYQEVVPNNNSISFEIKRMEDIYDIVKGKPDEPHRHNYYIVLIVLQAKGKHIIDFNEFDLKDNQMYFVSPGQVHQIIESEKSYGYAITFSKQFLAYNYIEESFVKDLYLFHENGFSPPLLLSDEILNTASSYAMEMYKIKNNDDKWKYQALGAWLKLLLILAQKACDFFPFQHTQSIQAGKVLLNDFKTLLNENYAQWHKVSNYATALNVTSDYLNTSVNSLTGTNVKAHIQNRILLAAKRMLLFTPLANKEISFQLGFSEPANFSQFFKKHEKIAPSAFRKQYLR